MGGILVIWESWQNDVVTCEEMKLCNNFGAKSAAEEWREQISPNNDS